MSDPERAPSEEPSGAASGARAEGPLPVPVRVVLALFALAVLLFAKDEPATWADGSRLGTIQALVEQGTLRLDDTSYFWQGDKVRFDGHYYSHQPPMLALFGAVPYAVLHYGLGRAIDDPHTYRVLTWTLVGLPLLLGFAELARLMRRAGCGPGWTAALVFLAAFGTLAWPYAVVLNQHGAAAGLVMIGLGLVARRRPLAAGVVLCLATTIDLTAVFAAVAFAWPVLLAGGAAAVLRYGLGALPPLALHLGVNRAIAGDFRPFGLHLEAFEYPLSPWFVMALTGDAQSEPAGTQTEVIWRALVGQSGLFSHHPILLLAVAAGIVLAFRRLRGRGAAASAAGGLPAGVLPAVAACSLAIAAYYLTQSRNLGGSCFGMRWFTVFSPLLALLPAAWIGTRPPGWRASPTTLALTAVLGLWSVLASSLGAVQPWAKFAYFYDQRPDAVLADPNAPRPSWTQHLRREWARIRNFRMRFGQEDYELWYADLIRRQAQVGLLQVSSSPEVQEQWTREALAKLHAVVDAMRQGGNKSKARAAGHFWTGRLHERLGELVQARREYATAIEFDPNLEAARRSLQRVDDETLGPREERP